MGVQTTKIPARTFGRKLRQELHRRNDASPTEFGVRTLARLLHDRQKTRGEEPRPVESLRRQLKTYLRENLPAKPRDGFRREIEDALEMDRDSLKDDEEGDKPVRMTIPVTVDVPLEALGIDYDLLARTIAARNAQLPPEQS